MQKWDGYVDKCQQTSTDRDELSRKYADCDRLQEVSRMKRWIYRIECDFCYERGMDLYYVDVSGQPESYTLCMACIKKKGWDE